jgi:hypothetical protein
MHGFNQFVENGIPAAGCYGVLWILFPIFINMRLAVVFAVMALAWWTQCGSAQTASNILALSHSSAGGEYFGTCSDSSSNV